MREVGEVGGPVVPPPRSGQACGQAVDVGSHQTQDPVAAQDLPGLDQGGPRIGNVFDEVDHGHGCEPVLRDLTRLEITDPDMKAVPVPRRLNGPGARLHTLRLPTPFPGHVHEDPGGRSHVEQRALVRAQLFQAREDALEVLLPALGLLLIQRVDDVGIQGLDEFPCGPGIGEDMAAASTALQAPDLPVGLVCDLDVFRSECLGLDVGTAKDGQGAPAADRAGLEPLHGMVSPLFVFCHVLVASRAAVRSPRPSSGGRDRYPGAS